MKKNAEQRFNPLVGLVVALVGMVVLLVAQHIPNRHGMEENLTQRSEQALRSAGLPQVRVTFTGRDGRLEAGSATEAERALDIVRALDGVRAAEAEVPPSLETAVMPAPPSVLLALTGGKVSISGTVPTEDSRTTLVAATVAAFGVEAVDNRLTVDDAVTDAALSGLPGLLRALGRDTFDMRAELTGGTLNLAGTVPSEARKVAVLASARDTGAAVVDGLRVPDVQRQLTSLPPLRFSFGSAALTPATRASLVKIGQVLNANPSTRIQVDGHTDSVGSARFNLALSRDRAEAVLDFLREQGVTADRLDTKGYGESRPKLSNTSSANRAVNRRVELVVM
ncbi:OmpA family protein [Micromonospora sp. NPDC050417]|uniref:OmpA family protein n=1 Tax=Micromonospora sp. NPDC050417 TaxID=3364280 RepID=UPI00379D704E